MKNYGSLILLFLLFWAGSIYFFIEAFHDLQVKHDGKIVEVVVETLPSFCTSKHNKMGVFYDGKSYTLPLQSVACRKGYYQVGQVIMCYWDQKRKKLYHSGLDPSSGFIIGIVVFIAPFLLWYKAKRDYKRAELAQGLSSKKTTAEVFRSAARPTIRTHISDQNEPLLFSCGIVQRACDDVHCFGSSLATGQFPIFTAWSRQQS